MFASLKVLTGVTGVDQLVELMQGGADIITALFTIVGTVFTQIWNLIVSNAIFVLPIALLLVTVGFRYLRRLINLLRGMFGSN